MGWTNEPECNNNERECNCCINIEDSIVVILCGEIEIERLRSCLQTAYQVKGNANLTE